MCNDEIVRLPYQDAELSGLFSFSVLTHIHPDKFQDWFRELARVLKPGALAYLTFNGDTITESSLPSHAERADAFREHGAAWLDKPGNYKSAAFLSHERIREMAAGIFEIEAVARRDYHSMDALYARVL